MKFFFFKNISIIFFSLLISSGTLLAQLSPVAPYSRFGVGELAHSQQAHLLGMGGIGVFNTQLYKLNLSNPASYSFLQTPVLNAGFIADFSTFKTENQSSAYNHGRINDLAFGLPFAKNKWGLAFGLTPYSNVGYSITTPTVLPDGLEYSTLYEGDGGINKAFAGLAFKVVEKIDTLFNPTALSLGVNVNYLFGAIRYARKTYFPETFDAVNYREFSRTSVKDVTVEIGMHFQTNLKKRSVKDPSYVKLLSGFTVTPGVDLSAKRSQVGESFVNSGTSEFVRDTVVDFNELGGRISLPLKVSVGAGIEYLTKKRSRMTFGLEYSMQQWSDFNESFPNATSEAELLDSEFMGVGFEIVPDISATGYFPKVEYRVGYRMTRSYLELRGERIEQSGISFGLSLPINARRNLTKSTFSIGAEYGNRGTTDEGLIEQNYLQLHLGLSLTPHFRNIWLKKRKYD